MYSGSAKVRTERPATSEARDVCLRGTVHVRDVMQREVATLDASDHLDVAHDVMQLGRIRHLPVLSGGRVIGIVSERNLFRATLSSVLAGDGAADEHLLADVPVRAVMTAPVFTVPPSASVQTALN